MKYIKELQNMGELNSTLWKFDDVMMQENKLHISTAKKVENVTVIHEIHTHNNYNLGDGG